MNQQKTPLFQALLKHYQNTPHSFHVPGHKNGTYFPDQAQALYQSILSIDQTELSGLDDLHDSNGVIMEAQKLTADLYGVEHSYFLIGGSTVGNLAMILTTCNENDVVLVQRNCHKSIIHGLQLAGVKAIYIQPHYDEDYHVPVGTPDGQLTKLIHKYPQAKAIILTYPNYYGLGFDLKESVKIAHQYDISVLVDEAHGAHFSLGGLFPPSTISFNADMIVQSAHKTLPAMTMGAFLHVNSSRVNIRKLEYYLQVLQSSSPSYPIMASLDLARYYISQLSQSDIDKMIAEINAFKHDLTTIPQICVIDQSRYVDYQDPLKLTIQTRCELSGYELQKRLEQEGIFSELADPYNVLFVFPLGKIKNRVEIIAKMKKALSNVNLEIPNFFTSNGKIITEEILIDYSSIKDRSTRCMPIKLATGHLAAESVIPYPPGIPILMMGEQITTSHIHNIFNLKEAGANFQGGSKLFQEGILIYN